MAASEFKKDPVLILRIDGEDLKEFVESSQIESKAIAAFSQMNETDVSLYECLIMALGHLSVEDGMPPSSDPWVHNNIVEPALQSLSEELEGPVSQETFIEKFKKLVQNIVVRLQEHPIIVAHSENTYDGNGIRRLLSNSFELNKLLDLVWGELAKDQIMRSPKDLLVLALDKLATSAELPPHGNSDQVDAIVNGVIGMVDVNDGKIFHEEVFKKTVTEILESISLRLGASPISVSTDTVIDEPVVSSLSPTSTQSE